MTMPNGRRSIAVCLLLIAPFLADSSDLPDDCGRLLSGPQHRHVIYVLCPSLPWLNQLQAHALVVSVLDSTTRRSGDVLIFFFRDEPVLHGQLVPAVQERLIETWGDAFVGSYSTQSKLLTVRSADSDKWLNVHLPIR